MAEVGYQASALRPAQAAGGSVGDFLALMKPRVMSLVVFTALVGMVLAPGRMHPVLAAIALICIAVGAGASGALNMWYDADIDALMQRTAARPIPRGRITPDEALTFGTVLAIGAVGTLGVIVNWVAGALLAFTIGFYVLVYTMWLKRRTPQNIVIGGAAGAVPVLVGWTAVTNSLDWPPVVLFAVIFYWTPPHFWALAIRYADDYKAAEETLNGALALWEKAVAPDSPRLLPVLDALGSVHRDNAAYAKAEPFYARALMVREAALGPDSAEILSNLDSLAYVYFGQKKFAEAFNSFGVMSQVKRGDQMAQAYKIQGVPALAVDGKYLVGGKDFNEQLAIADKLIAKARSEKSGKK